MHLDPRRACISTHEGIQSRTCTSSVHTPNPRLCAVARAGRREHAACRVQRCAAHAQDAIQTQTLTVRPPPHQGPDGNDAQQVCHPPFRVSRRKVMTALLTSSAAASWHMPHASEATAASQQTDDIKAAYDSFAPSYDALDGGGAATALGFDELREQLLSQAQGEVVEVAVGTGLNLQHYRWGPAGVRQLRALDLSEGMLSQARARVAASQQLSGHDITFQQADATSLPLASASADSLVDTFSLCVIPDPAAALQEMARVVRPDGRVLLLEHTRSDNPFLAAYQDVTADAVARTAKGCVWNQDIPALLKQAGLTPVRLERHVGGTILLVEAVKAKN